MTTEAPQRARIARPPWFRELLRAFSAASAHTFILHGNVQDYVYHPVDDGEPVAMTLTNYLRSVLSGPFGFLIYAPDTGLEIPAPSDEWIKPEIKELFFGGASAPSETERLLAQAGAGAPTGDDLPIPTSPTGALPLALRYLEQHSPRRDADARIALEDPRRLLLLVERMDLVAPPDDKARMSEPQKALLSQMFRAGTSPLLAAQGAMTLLLAPSLAEVHPDLRQSASGIRTIAIPMPTHEERAAVARAFLAKHDVALADGLTIEELAAQTAGLTRRNVEDIVLVGRLDSRGVTREIIRREKAALLSAEYAEVLEALETDVTLDMVGGHDQIKAYLQTYVIDMLRNPETRAEAPLSVLFSGASGTGKTLTAQAVANAIGFNVVQIRPDKVKGSYVGESEKLLAKALDGIEALAPVVVYWDEIDQGGRRTEQTSGDGGSAVEANAFSAILEFFGNANHRGKIFTVMATNRPDLVDPAFLRPGRTDDKIPFLPPESSDERIDVLERLIKRHRAAGAYAYVTLTDVAERTRGWTQAELERLVLKARAIARATGRGFDDALLDAMRRLRTSTRDIERMTQLALEACDDIDLVPERFRERVGRKGQEATRATPPVPMIGRGGQILDLG